MICFKSDSADPDLSLNPGKYFDPFDVMKGFEFRMKEERPF